ncbi:MAG: hypothetical protein LLF94_08140 [Chlamydiales bacterium]|nr:hypothetical protein [Chlamydiales bacterium]
MSTKSDLHDEIDGLRNYFKPIAYADWDKDQVTSSGKVVTKGWLGRMVSCCEGNTFDIAKTVQHLQSVIKNDLPAERKIVQHSHECKELYPQEDGTAICLQACLLYREVRRAVEVLNRHPEVTDKDKINLQALGLGEPTQKVVTFPISKVLRVPRKKERDKEPITTLAHEIEALKCRLQEEMSSPGFSLQQLVFFTPELCHELPLWLKSVLGASLPAIGVMHMINVLERFDKNTGKCSTQITALKEALDTALILSVLILEPSNARKLQLVQELEYHLHDRLKQQRLEGLQPGERLLIPAGYFNGNVYDLFSFTVNIGHLVMVEFLKQKDGTFDIHCYDASNIMHHETVTTEGDGQKKILPWTIG